MMKLINRLLVIAVIAFGSWFLVQQWDKVETIQNQEMPTEITEEIITGEEFIETKVTEVTQKYDTIDNIVLTEKPVRKIKPVQTAIKPVAKVMETPQPVRANTESEMTVYLFDGGFDVSRSTIPAGNITFNVRNDGRMAHEFAVEGIKDFGRVNPGEMNAFTLTLETGEYVLFSPRAVDQTLNMRETLAVESAE